MLYFYQILLEKRRITALDASFIQDKQYNF